MGDGLQKDIPSFNSYHILFYNFFPDPASLFVLLREMLKQFVYPHFYVPPPGNWVIVNRRVHFVMRIFRVELAPGFTNYFPNIECKQRGNAFAMVQLLYEIMV